MARVGVDETAARRRHDYITLFVDLDEARLLFATPGKESATVEAFTADLAAHGGAVARVKEVACDMSPAFTKGVRESLPEAEITYDRFHVIAVIGAASSTNSHNRARTTAPAFQERFYPFKTRPARCRFFSHRGASCANLAALTDFGF